MLRDAGQDALGYDVWYGGVKQGAGSSDDWKALPDVDDDPDDERLPHSPPAVVDILGVDPLDLDLD